jgi:hypothetical protein
MFNQGHEANQLPLADGKSQTQYRSADSPRTMHGLQARDRRRAKNLQQFISEAPCAPHKIIVLADRLRIFQKLEDALRKLALIPSRFEAPPPRAWYRLDSIGRSYNKQQKIAPFKLVRGQIRSERILVPPDSLAESLQQVMLVDRRLRLVIEVAARQGDGSWLIRSASHCLMRRANLVFASNDGSVYHLSRIPKAFEGPQKSPR